MRRLSFGVLFLLISFAAWAEETDVKSCRYEGQEVSAEALAALLLPPQMPTPDATVKLGQPKRDSRGYFVPVLEGWATFVPLEDQAIFSDNGNQGVVRLGRSEGVLAQDHPAQMATPLTIRLQNPGSHSLSWKFQINEQGSLTLSRTVQVPVCEVPAVEPLAIRADWNVVELKGWTVAAVDSIAFEIGKVGGKLTRISAGSISPGPYVANRTVWSELFPVEPNTDYVFRIVSKSECYSEEVYSRFETFRTPVPPRCPPQCVPLPPPPPPLPPPICSDPNAVNYGGPLPCRYVFPLTLAATDISPIAATLHGTLSVQGTTWYWFEYGTSPGVMNRSTLATQVSITGQVHVLQTAYNLYPDTTYYFRLVVQYSFGTAYGNILSFTTAFSPPNPLTAAKNASFGNPTVAAGAVNVKIGSYNLSTSSAEGVNVYNLTITITMPASSTSFQNLKVLAGGTQFGATKSILSGSYVVTFSGSTNVPAGATKTVDVYADVLSSASVGTYATLTTLTSCIGTGASTNTSIACSPTSVAGQNVIVSTGAGNG